MKPMHLPQPTAPSGAIDRRVDPMGWVRVGVALGYRDLGHGSRGWIFAVIRRSAAP